MKINNSIIRISSINCESCGAGLGSISSRDSCKCDYCGNINLILKDGKTKIISIPKKDPIPTVSIKKEESKLSNNAKWIIILGVGILGLAFIYYYFIKKNKDDENKKSIATT